MADYSRDEAAIARLTPEQYRVTQESGTERPGTGELLGGALTQALREQPRDGRVL